MRNYDIINVNLQMKKSGFSMLRKTHKIDSYLSITIYQGTIPTRLQDQRAGEFVDMGDPFLPQLSFIKINWWILGFSITAKIN